MDQQNILPGQTVRYFEQGAPTAKSAFGSSANGNDGSFTAIVDRAHSNGSLDLTILSPQGIQQKTAVPQANWQPTQYTEQVNRSLQNA